MGKSPGKWIKSVLFWKKSSKPDFTKQKENLLAQRSASKNAGFDVSDLLVVPLVVSHSPTRVSPGNEVSLSYIEGSSNKLANDTVALTSKAQNGAIQTVHDLTSPHDRTEKSRREQAVTQVQAICRGYLARQKFRSLKGIVRLQALVRGHVVRRQAVASLCCVLSIVKFQASVCRPKEPKSRCSLATITSLNFVKNAIARRLLASSPSPRPLRDLCGLRGPNSAWEWLQRWTRSQFWLKEGVFGLKSQVKLGSATKSDTQTSMPGHGLNRPHDELAKFERKMKKVSSSTARASDQIGNTTKVLETIDPTHNENLKRKNRRASLPAKSVRGLVHNTGKEPSYMSATESAKAKLRMQVRPTLANDGVEKIGYHRRHSLPCSLNGDLDSFLTPVHQLAHPSGKVRVGHERSLSSSKNDTNKAIRPEWRR